MNRIALPILALSLACVSCSQVWRIKPDYAKEHLNLGDSLASRGKVDEAIVQFRMALEIKPDYAEAHVSLANALVSVGRTDEAIVHYQMALKIKPDYPEAKKNLEAATAHRHGKTGD
jgi:tetratricopeptide (TPR) repeat protein